MSSLGARAKHLYLVEGLTLREIGSKIGRSHQGVANLLRAEGVTLRSRAYRSNATAPCVPRIEREHADRELEAPPPAAAPERPFMGRREKTNRASVRRFSSPKIEPERVRDLAAEHPAAVEGRSLFSGKVVGARQSPRLLVSGHNNPKLGREVLKGPRAGWPIFHLTLEERATCPRSCTQWLGCYGNAMHMARRHRADAELMAVLRAEVAATAKLHPGGFLVRLHTLGDFFSVEYVLMWAELLAAYPALHVFGYTARREDDPDPQSAKIARAIAILTRAMWSRFAIRTSHAEVGPQRSVVVMADPGRDDVIMCPAQTHATEACATCGVCWAEAARGKAIGFLKHGMKRRGRVPAAPTPQPAPPTIPQPPTAVVTPPAPNRQAPAQETAPRPLPSRPAPVAEPATAFDPTDDDEPIAGAPANSLLALGYRRCKWPMNDPPAGYGELTRFCCAETDEGKPYCPDHMEAATAKASGRVWTDAERAQAAARARMRAALKQAQAGAA